MPRATRHVGANIKDGTLVAERREHIVRAAIEVFLEKGFNAATTRDVCVKAGITQGTLYNYVRSKEDILYLVIDHVSSRYHEVIAEAVKDVDDPQERLVRMVRATVEAQYRFRSHILLINREVHLLGAPARKAIRARADDFFDEVHAIVEAGLPKQPGRTVDVSLLAQMVTFMPMMFAFRPWRMKGAPEQNIAGVTEMVLNALGVDGKRKR